MTIPTEPDATAFDPIALAALETGDGLGLPRWDTRERLLEVFDRIAAEVDALEHPLEHIAQSETGQP